MTADDASGSVTVQASDGEHPVVTQTFSWTASNVDPLIGTITVTPTSACAVNLSGAFGDAGSGDTHVAGITWGDEPTGTTPALAADVSPVTGSHAYTQAGTYTAAVTVRDDDGGSHTKSAPAGFTTFNTPSVIMQPINTTGTRSGFKIGSTIPVKITVTNCSGAPVSTLTPQVHLQKVDNTPDVAVNEPVITEVPTNGKLMRWTGDMYHYTLSTKLSIFNNGADLTAGSYMVSVNDATFFAPVKAWFDLRK